MGEERGHVETRERPMSRLPESMDPLLIRTDFDDEEAWSLARTAALAEASEGRLAARAFLHIVDDKRFARVTAKELRGAALPLANRQPVLFVVDTRTLADDDHPVQVVDLTERDRRPFRCIARLLWMVENSLSVSNMDWEDFAEQADADGVFRGFPRGDEIER
jgi:hypothetical protein